MKKILLSALLIPAGIGLFAQDAQDEGLKVAGSVKTGLRFATDQFLDGDGTAIDKDHAFEVWDDSYGVVQLDFEGSYTKENYGLVFRLRVRPIELYQDAGEVHNLLNQGYVWGDFLNKIIHVKAGKLDDSAWAAPGDQCFSYSTGYGVRFEIKPIKSLNIGFFLNPGDDALSTRYNDPSIDFDVYRATDNGLGRRVKDFFLETGFGAKFSHESVDVAAGLRLDSEADGITTLSLNDYTTLDHSLAEVNAGDGLRFYFGAGLKALENITAAVEVQFYNLGAFSEAGWVWITEKFAYKLGALTVGLIMHQYFFGADNIFVDYYEDNRILKDDHNTAPHLSFNPTVSYDITEKWNIGLEIPFAIWPDVLFTVEPKAKAAYKLGDTASISGYYQFGILQYDSHTGQGKMENGEYKTPDLLLKNAVQINFEWSF